MTERQLNFIAASALIAFDALWLLCILGYIK